MTTAWWRRWAWVAVLAGGLLLYVSVLTTLVATQNITFVPSMILLGAVIVPATFLTFAQGRSGRWQVPGSLLGLTAFLAGVIGVVAAGRLGAAPVRGRRKRALQHG
jgi:drug/metabolite transporter (DMT)-like permease